MAEGDGTVRMCGIESPVHCGAGRILARAATGIWPGRARDNGSQMFQVNQKETAPGVSFTAGRRSSGALVLIRRGSACRTSAGAGAGLSRILFLRHAFSLSVMAGRVPATHAPAVEQPPRRAPPAGGGWPEHAFVCQDKRSWQTGLCHIVSGRWVRALSSWPGVSRPPTHRRLYHLRGGSTGWRWVAGTRPAMTV